MRGNAISNLTVVAVLLVSASLAQAPQAAKGGNPQLSVNWLYGAYVPKDVPLIPLNGHQRVQLWIRSSFTTYGIYVKSTLFTISDQINNDPSEWGDGGAGFGKRLASRQGQFVIQNSLSAAANGLVGYEPRYDRCHCRGFWPRTGHALARNFITYSRDDASIRPQIPLYAAAFGAGVAAGTWTPGHTLVNEGLHGVAAQASVGMLSNFIGEFWPEILQVLKRN